MATNNGDNDDEVERPTDEELRIVIRRLIPKVDLDKTGVKKFTKLLARECGGLDLSHRTDFIRTALTQTIDELSDDADDDDEEDDEDDDSDDDDEDQKPNSKKSRGGGGGGGLGAKKEISPELATFLGFQGKEMARTEIVKMMWNYIKEHSLQNPSNKREILLDDRMKQVFGCDVFTMFTMNKYLGAHIHPFKPVDLTPPKKVATTNKRGRTNRSSSSSRRSSNDDPPIQNKKRKASTPRKPGTQPPYRLSPQLAALLGKDILPRPQVVSALWDYIKQNNLQNPNDKREILCDDALKVIMGNKAKVTMFNMNTYIGDHLVEKLDRSSYQHDVTGKADRESENDEK